LRAELILMAGLTSTRALIGNSVEFGSASNPTAAVQGAKLKILMVFNDRPPGDFMAQPGIKTVTELRGKRVGGSTVGSLDYGWLKGRQLCSRWLDKLTLHGATRRQHRCCILKPAVEPFGSIGRLSDAVSVC
jgi:hypothetical protein